MDTDISLTVVEVAERLGVSAKTVHRKIADEQLPAFEIGSGTKRRHWRVRVADVEAFEQGRRS